MAQPTLPRSVYEETARLFYSSGQNVARAARSAGLAYNTFSSRIRKARALGIITDKSKNDDHRTDQPTENISCASQDLHSVGRQRRL